MNSESVGGQQFDALYRKHHDAVFRACLRFAAGDRDWAMDRTHDVFVILARRMGKLTDTDDLGGWLYRVAFNTCLMDLRRARGWRKVKDQLLGWVGPAASTPERNAQAKRDVSKLELAVRELPVKQRVLITLVHLDGKTQSEAARLLSLSEGQVSKLYKKALSNLQACDWEIDHA
jgi:RNA polymerase sigma-70 factor (ECF subfamily)